ncbi:MAG TPA: TIGR02206 family membrane protein [Candidatus Dormibacteraeota bacterium]|nr:TIGR02206 family membrane protein [Candidatus Dormibacteraeota bacterium]
MAISPDLIALPVIVVVAAALTAAVRIRPGRWTELLTRSLAVVMLVAELCWWGVEIVVPGALKTHGLPLQICDVAAILAAGALWFRWQPLVDITWWWGIAGSIPALLTPLPGAVFPNWLYFQYFIVHGGLIVSACVLVVGLRRVPAPGAVLRVAAVTVVYAAGIALLDHLTAENLLFLCGYPGGPPTLLNMLGPWPRYLVPVAVIAAVLFFLLELACRPLRPSRRAAEGA